MYIKQPLWIVAIVLLAGTVVYGMVVREDNVYTNPYIEANKTVYMQYIKKYRGKWNLQKNKQIIQQNKRLDTAKKKLDECAEALSQEKISEQQYIEKSLKYEKILKQKNIVERLYAQNEYASENPERHYLLYTNGWNNYFTHFVITILYSVFYIMCGALAFGMEYENNMDAVNRVTHFGNGVLYRAKIVQLVLSVSFFAIVQWLLNIIVIKCRYGLEGVTYPLQSLSIFKDCTNVVSIGQMLGIILALKIVGAIYITLCSAFLSLFLKKIVNTIIVSISVMVIPVFFLSHTVLYAMPFPMAFSNIGGYVNGMFDENSGQSVFFSLHRISGMLVFAVILSGILAVIGNWIYQKKIQIVLKKLCVRKNMKIIGGMIAIGLLCTGCQRHTEDNRDQPFNNNGIGLITVFDDGVIYADKTSMKLQRQGKQEDLFKNPLVQEADYDNLIVNQAVADATICIRMNLQTKESEILKVPLQGSQETILYKQHSNSLAGYNFLNLYQKKLDFHSFEKVKEITNCWMAGKNLYAMAEDSVYRISQNGKSEILFSDGAGSALGYSNGKIIYINNRYRASMYDIKSKENVEITDYPVSALIVLKQSVIMQNRNGNIQKYFFKTQKREVLGTKKGNMMHADEKSVYCQKSEKELEIICQKVPEKSQIIKLPDSVMEVKSKEDGSVYYIAVDQGGKTRFLEKPQILIKSTD